MGKALQGPQAHKDPGASPDHLARMAEMALTVYPASKDLWDPREGRVSRDFRVPRGHQETRA